MKWNSKQYLKFVNERSQPCLDLINRISGDFKNILDLGSGPGNSTTQLQNYFGNSKIIGFEADENMIQKAKQDYPKLEFVQGFAPNDLINLNAKFDLIFSNACIHWIKDQVYLIDTIEQMLENNGTFAVQIPITSESKFYNLLDDLIEKKWQSLKKIKNFYNLNQSQYYNLLSNRFNDITVWKTDYYHLVDDFYDVIEWYKGSGLRPYLNALSELEQKEFLCDLEIEIKKNYTILNDGKIFLVMPRLFFIAKKQSIL